MKKTNKLLSICLCTLMLLNSGCSFYKLPDIENHNLDEYYKEDAAVYKTLYSSETMSLNYLSTNALVDNVICSNVIDCLIDYDSYGKIVPGLAESWDSNNTMTQWTFHLRDNLKWVDHNGNYYDDVTSDDWLCAAEYADDNDLAKPIDFTVEAPDEKTIIYTLKDSCPFFLSMLSYSAFLPVSRSYLKKVGPMFAKDHKNLLYCGAFILHYFQPFEKQILVKNPSYWDKENVYIDRVENYYDYDASDVSVEMFLEGSIDRAIIPYDQLVKSLEDPDISQHIHRSRPDSSFTYFYAFNFDPQFDEKYDPENWKKAVVNENFRKAVMASLYRSSLLSVYEPNDPDSLINNTITPPRSLWIEGQDYTQLPALNAISGRDSYSIAQAKYFRKLAKAELDEEGVKYPIKILMPYDPSVEGWVKEAYKAELMIEAALGRNFVDVVVEAGNDTGFTTSVIESGKYAFTKCRWGANFSDPLTWAEPFTDDYEYTFWNRCSDTKIAFLNAKWNSMIQQASSINYSQKRRYIAFAEAEKFLINNAIIVPISIMNGDGYEMCNLNEFEGEFAPYGAARRRYKHMHLYNRSMNMDEYKAAYDQWLKGF